MATQILDGKMISANIRTELKESAAAFLRKAGRKAGLATILVGENPASHTYVANKIKACAEIGMESIHHPLPASTSTADLISLMKKLNADTHVDGILLQLPLPGNADSTPVLGNHGSGQKTQTACIPTIWDSFSEYVKAGRK